MIIEGRALKYGDGVNTDLIFPGRYMTLIDPQEIAKHALAGLDPDFPTKIKTHGIVVAGKNFGCGSSREHAPLSMKYAGTRCIIAESFARIFLRNAVNIGLPVLECKKVTSEVEESDLITINLSEGLLSNRSQDKTLKTEPLPPFLIAILQKGGLIGYLNSEEI